MPTVASRQISIQDFAGELRNFPESAFRGTEQVLEFMNRNRVDPESLTPYINWDKQHYTRNLIEKNQCFELLAICWEIGQASSVHNHRDQNCWMAAPIGRLQVENFHTVQQDVEAGKCELTRTNTVEMNAMQPCAVDPADPVHRVVNPREFNQRAVSLHVYSRPFDTCVVYSPEQGTCGVIGLHYTTEYGEKVE
jgi:cysteine dioxygenase